MRQRLSHSEENQSGRQRCAKQQPKPLDKRELRAILRLPQFDASPGTKTKRQHGDKKDSIKPDVAPTGLKQDLVANSQNHTPKPVRSGEADGDSNEGDQQRREEAA